MTQGLNRSDVRRVQFVERGTGCAPYDDDLQGEPAKSGAEKSPSRMTRNRNQQKKAKTNNTLDG